MGIDCAEAARSAAEPAGQEARRAARVEAAAHNGQVVVPAGLLRGSLPGGVWLMDLGPEVPNNLSAQLSSFIGRDEVLAEVNALVAGSRLVTLTGAGGAGKTRLALRVAARLLDGTRDGVWFVDLAPLADPDLVAVAVAGVLGVRLESGRPVLGTVVEVVGERSLLVVLDNCEHVINACAKLADPLLRSCPNLALLATSREPLGLDGERVYRVPSMSVPAESDDADAIRASEAVRLLADRATVQGVPLAGDEQTARVAGRICRRLDGIPLAIELAAARLRVMSAAELEARLDERFALLTGGSRAALERQQTLRAMVDWSWELLSGAEGAVLARLSVFAGGFGAAAAEAVAAGAEVTAGEFAVHLGALVDKSLVQFGDIQGGPGRYRLLETVRQYAAGRLDALGPEAVDAARSVHREYYLALAEEADPQLLTTDRGEWMDRLDAELDNLRAAIAFSLTQPDLEPGLRLAASLRRYWNTRGYAAEGADTLRELLDAPAAQAPTLARARALFAAVTLAERTGGYAVADRYCQEALPIARAAGDDQLAARLLSRRAWILLRQGQPRAALPVIESGLRLAHRLQPRIAADLLAVRSHALEYEGDHVGAARDAAKSVELCRQTGDRPLIGHGLGLLGAYELSAGDVDAARRHLRESLGIAREFNHRLNIITATFNLGLADYLGGSPDAAAALFAESLDLARRMGSTVNVAYALTGVALVGRCGTDHGWSARMHGAADQALADLGHTVEPLERRLAGQDRQRLRAALGDRAFEAEYAAGRTLGLAAAVAEFDSRGAAAEPAHTERAGAPVSERDSAVPRAAVAVLTSRELDVLTLVAQGLSNAEIARRLVLSDHTVHRHLANILRKLSLSSRAAAVAWGVRSGLM